MFKDVLSRNSDFAALASRLSRLSKSKNIMAALMKYGIKNEPVAAKTDSEITGNVCICGFFILLQKKNPSKQRLIYRVQISGREQEH